MDESNRVAKREKEDVARNMRNVEISKEDPEFSGPVTKLIGIIGERETPGGLPVGTKHLIWLAVQCALKQEPTYIRGHMRTALNHGYTLQQILEAIEVTVPSSGYPSFLHGYHIWKEIREEMKNKSE